MSDIPMQESAQDEDALLRAYNDVAYTSHPDFATHPDHLATVATLLGLDVAPVATCRVLELACGDGTNLLPVAAALPNATFVGIDFAARPVARAQRMASDLGLANVRVLQRDLRELPADLGTFDYVIAHGLYSWVPADVRAHVLPLIARHLAPAGVAFVSYNTLPGCHMRRAVWEMLRFHTRQIEDKRAKVTAARSLIALVAAPVVGEDGGVAALRAEVRLAGEGDDGALAHDDISEPNDPVYFHEFMADASRAGLAFLAEAHLGKMMGAGIAPAVRDALGPVDRLTREQYLDFIFFRRFRETLLCHANALSGYVVQPHRALGMHAYATPDLRRAAAGPAPVAGAGTDVAALTSHLLAHWPNSIPVADLAEWRNRLLPANAKQPHQPIEMLLAELYVASQVGLRTTPVTAVATPGEFPVAFAAARWMGREQEVVPTLYHEPIRLNDAAVRKLVGLLDGTRTRDDLIAAMGDTFSGPNGRTRLDSLLNKLAKEALLVG